MTESNQGSTLASLSRNERDRLVQLTGGAPPSRPPARRTLRAQELSGLRAAQTSGPGLSSRLSTAGQS